MRLQIVAGNWKMHKTLDAFRTFNEQFISLYSRLKSSRSRVVIFPPALYLSEQADIVAEHTHLFCGAQNCYSEDQGAFTGEISSEMIRSCGGDYVIIGHSERRQLFNETNGQIARKVTLAQQNHLIPVLCCGEMEKERTEGRHFDIVTRQLTEGLTDFNPDESDLVVAYEPVWAIGTGNTATPAQAQEMHAHVRNILSDKLGPGTAEKTPVLYGGSVKPSNCAELFACSDIDGGLIGGASLKPEDFLSLIKEMDRKVRSGIV